jgi:choline dehydrogenase
LIITGNLNATTIMIGEKIADHIRGRQPLARSTASYYKANGAPVRQIAARSEKIENRANSLVYN